VSNLSQDLSQQLTKSVQVNIPDDLDLSDLSDLSEFKNLKTTNMNRLVQGILVSDILSQGVVLSALFPFFATEDLTKILTQTPLHYFMFPFLGFTELVLLGVSTYYFCNSKNKNWQVTSRLLMDLMKVSAINAAVVGSIVAPAIFSPIAPVLFMAALGLASGYNLMMSLWYTRKISRISDVLLKKQYINERKVALLNTFVLSFSVFAIGFLMLNPIGGALGIALVAATVAVTLFNVSYLGYSFYKNKNVIPVVKRQDSEKFIIDKVKELDLDLDNDSKSNLLNIIRNKINILEKNKNKNKNKNSQYLKSNFIFQSFFSDNKKRDQKINLLNKLCEILDDIREDKLNLKEQADEYKSVLLNFDENYKFSFQSFFSYISDTAKIVLAVGSFFDSFHMNNDSFNNDDFVQNPLTANIDDKKDFSHQTPILSGSSGIDNSYEEDATNILNIGIGV
jgi:hypothetical protein